MQTTKHQLAPASITTLPKAVIAIALLNLPLSPTSPNTVSLCAVSAIARPRTTMRSKVEISAARRAAWAARNRATFSAGVSDGGPLLTEPGAFLVVLEYFPPGGVDG